MEEQEEMIIQTIQMIHQEEQIILEEMEDQLVINNM